MAHIKDVKVHCPLCGEVIAIRCPTDKTEEWDSLVNCTSCRGMFFAWRTHETITMRVVIKYLKEVR